MKRIFAFLILCLFFAGCAGIFEIAENSFDDESSQNDASIPLISSELTWKQVEMGLFWTQVEAALDEKTKQFILVKIDPKLFSFEIEKNKNQKNAQNLQEIQEKNKAIVTFNGAFFGENFQSISFLKSENKKLGDFSKADLMNGVFVITRSNQAKLIESTKFQDSNEIVFALQNGPVLLNSKKESGILSDDGKQAARTALGIDHDGNIIVVVIKPGLFNSENTLTLYEFVEFLQKSEPLNKLGLHSVLNLDGGPSSGIIIQDHYYPEMDMVQNVVIVKKK